MSRSDGSAFDAGGYKLDAVCGHVAMSMNVEWGDHWSRRSGMSSSSAWVAWKRRSGSPWCSATSPADRPPANRHDPQASDVDGATSLYPLVVQPDHRRDDGARLPPRGLVTLRWWRVSARIGGAVRAALRVLGQPRRWRIALDRRRADLRAQPADPGVRADGHRRQRSRRCSATAEFRRAPRPVHGPPRMPPAGFGSVQFVQQGGMPSAPSSTLSGHADHRIPHALDIDEVAWLVREYGESAGSRCGGRCRRGRAARQPR